VLCRGIQAALNTGELGREDEVLVEKEARDPGQVLGRTRRNKFVAFPAEGAQIGDYTWVQLKRTTGPTFQGARVLALAPGGCP
jgi:tRNA A37 methylthiotransferase MiaB